MEIPFEIKQAMEVGNAILFVGAGMGFNMLNEEGEHAPDSHALARMIADRFDVPVTDDIDLAKVSQYVCAKKGSRSELTTYIRSILAPMCPDSNMHWIASVKWKAIFTTNYDNCIEKAYDCFPNPVQNYSVVTHLSGIKEFYHDYEVPIVHLHGSLFAPSSPEIIITQQDYIKYNVKRKSLFDMLKHYLATSCVLYTGYSHNDSNFMTVLSDLAEEMYPSPLPTSYRIDPNTSEVDKFLLEQQNIYSINLDFSDFVSLAKEQLQCRYTVNEKYGSLETHVPEKFIADYQKNPLPFVRLYSSWEYVAQIIVNSQVTVHDFLRGEKADWGIIYNDFYFKRTIEENIYESILDHVTAARNCVNSIIILSPAGYGKSTLLKSLTKDISKENIADVYFFHSEKEFRVGDVFFACECTPDTKHIFFIDDAANNISEIKQAITRIAQMKHDALFVLCERQNEWQQKRVTIRGDVHQIPPLDDIEIERLLDLLGSHGELNKLYGLPRDHQTAAIRVNYNRELLVAIREATEGISFDAIIKDEFFSIEDNFARQIYAIVSCFHQSGALLRVELMAALAGCSLTELYERIRTPLSGVVAYEDINDGLTDYAIRSRHRIISTIVWNSCLSSDERDHIMHNALDNLNITYRLDKMAFNSFVFNDSMIDMLSSDESKQQFFEKVCKKDPDNPFVWQHYSRMLARIKRFNAALGIIDQAIRMDASRQMLYHTKGYILQNMAKDNSNIEIARRYFGQSENVYNTALSMNARDAYCYQGIISLNLDWARRVDISDAERALSLAKAEESVEKGLVRANEKEPIWIESSRIDEYVGNMPNRISALQHALENAPTSILSKYLLAKAYLSNQQHDKAAELLKSIVLDSPTDYRSSMEYVKVLLQIDENNIAQAIAVLEQSTLYGYSDARFMAMLGGLCYINRNFSRAEEVFREASKRKYPNGWKVYFDSKDIGIATEIDAEISYVGDGYAWLRISNYPNIKCRTSKYNGIPLKEKMWLKIHICASPREAVALIDKLV